MICLAGGRLPVVRSERVFGCRNAADRRELIPQERTDSRVDQMTGILCCKPVKIGKNDRFVVKNTVLGHLSLNISL